MWQALASVHESCQHRVGGNTHVLATWKVQNPCDVITSKSLLFRSAPLLSQTSRGRSVLSEPRESNFQPAVRGV